MFNLGGLNDLANSLGLKPAKIARVLDDFDENPSSLVHELTLWRGDSIKKPRDVISVRRPWQLIQERIYLKLLLPQFKPSRYSHGGVRRRSTATNARAHLGNTHAFVADISNFFPSISCGRVNKLFLKHACSYRVAAVLTRLCTYDFHLALGLMTSPIIANEILKQVDVRIAHACHKLGLVYTRFIDDITISGKFDLASSGIASDVDDIVGRHGFRLAPGKSAYGRLDGEIAITGVRLRRDHLDPAREYVIELERLIDDHASLAGNGQFKGPLMTEGEMFGKAHYACALNPGRRRSILARLKKIDWCGVMNNAVERDLQRQRDRLTERGSPRPDCGEPLPLSAGAKFCAEYYQSATYDPSIAPFDVCDGPEL